MTPVAKENPTHSHYVTGCGQDGISLNSQTLKLQTTYREMEPLFSSSIRKIVKHCL